ncbi:hypothetical protein [Ruegeria atlantica]|uniref:hypothetical protein n=1 Tax=Ruegeria atlantica TaxID=81569 RepID=UPI0014818552|nr:hypothetical protein [Ruegeria atlantica]
MAEVRGANGAVNYQIQTSQPEVIQRHDISDEELDMLCQSRSDMALEILLVALGSAVGTLPVAIPTLYSAFAVKGPINLTAGSLLQILIFFGSLTCLAATGVVYARRAKSSVSLRDSIRRRTSGNDGDLA